MAARVLSFTLGLGGQVGQLDEGGWGGKAYSGPRTGAREGPEEAGTFEELKEDPMAGGENAK